MHKINVTKRITIVSYVGCSISADGSRALCWLSYFSGRLSCLILVVVYNGQKEKGRKKKQRLTRHYIVNLKMERHEHHSIPGVNPGTLEEYPVPTPHEVFLLLHTLNYINKLKSSVNCTEHLNAAFDIYMKTRIWT